MTAAWRGLVAVWLLALLLGGCGGEESATPTAPEPTPIASPTEAPLPSPSVPRPTPAPFNPPLPPTFTPSAVPVVYDICFAATHRRLYGVANPGAALHHWDFRLEDGALRLRFLTTFGGNTNPTWLTATRVQDQSAWFRADSLDHLSVGIELGDRRADIHVLLHDKPHVDIRLLAGAGQCEPPGSP